VLEEQVTVPKVHEVMDSDGEFIDPALQASVLELGATLARKLLASEPAHPPDP